VLEILLLVLKRLLDGGDLLLDLLTADCSMSFLDLSTGSSHKSLGLHSSNRDLLFSLDDCLLCVKNRSFDLLLLF